MRTSPPTVAPGARLTVPPITIRSPVIAAAESSTASPLITSTVPWTRPPTVAAPFVAPRQARAPHEPGAGGGVVEPDRLLRHEPGQLLRLDHDAAAVGLDDDRRVLRGGDRRAKGAENGEDQRAHRGSPGGCCGTPVQGPCRLRRDGGARRDGRARGPATHGPCHPATVRGGSRRSRRMRR